MSITKKLADLGLTLPPAPVPAGKYAPARKVGNLIFTSGQLPFVDGKCMVTGKVGGTVDMEQAQEAARICILNAIASAASQVGGVENLAEAIKVTCFVASVPEFTQQPAVGDAASAVLEEAFGSKHARSAFGVVALPADAAVEIEVVFAVK